MNKELSDLLNSLIADNVSIGGSDSGHYTHVTVFPPTQRWLIRPHKIGTFWERYCNLVNKNQANLCMAENVGSGAVAPLIADFKFGFHATERSQDPKSDPEGLDPKSGDTDPDPDPEGVEDTEYDSRFMLTLISCFQQVLLETLQISDSKLELVCCVLESHASWIETNIDESRILCRSIRLQFPFCRIETPVASQLIFPRVIALYRQKNVIGLLPSQPCNDWDKIMDLDVMNKPILMYGSVNHPAESVKTLSFIYGVIERDHVDGLVDPISMDSSEIFKFKHHPDVVSGSILREHIEEDDIDYWLPMALSVHFWTGVVRIRDHQETKTQFKKLKIGSVKLGDDDFTLCKSFIPMLSQKRLNDKNYWIDIGQALYNSNSGADDGLEEWIKVTRGSENSELDQELCEKLYPTFGNSNITVKTMAWYVKEDAPENYENWHQKWIQAALDESLSMLDNDIAKALYRCYWLEFSFVPHGVRSGAWYKFRHHRWMKDEKSLELKRRISNDFIRRYEKLRVHYSQMVMQTVDDYSKGRLEDKIDKINKILKPLKKNDFKRKLVNEAEEFFEIENFSTLLDQNPNCIGHTNYVSEVCDDEIVFRSGKPEDYISKSTGVKYNPNLTWEDETVKKVLKWFHQIFPDEELFECFCKYGASWFIGGNPDKIIPCWTGEGDNSKSMLEKGFEAAFGDYCFKVDNAIVTALNKNPNGATPQLAQMNGARGGFTDELDEEETMKSSFLKKLAGADTFFGRFLHDNGGKIKVTFKFILVCNKVPQMNSVHKSIRSKFFIFPFLSVWSNQAPVDEATQFKQKHFKKDPRFEKQIPKLAPAILWLFARYYPKYIKEGLKIPKIVEDFTNDYWKDVDVYQLFKQEYIGEAWIDKQKGIRNENARVSVQDLHREFKPWFKNNYEGEKVPNFRSFKLEMVRIFGKLSEDKFLYGLCITSRQAVNLDQQPGNGQGQVPEGKQDQGKQDGANTLKAQLATGMGKVSKV